MALSTGRAAAEAANNPEQIAAFADGLLTSDEYAASLQSFITCAEEAGYTFAVAEADWNGLFYVYGATSQDASSAEYDRCYNHHAGAVDHAYQMLHGDEFNAVIEQMVRCLVASGIPRADLVDENDNPKHPGMIQAEQGQESWNTCVEATKADRISSLPDLEVSR